MYAKSISQEDIDKLQLSSFPGEITVIDKLGKEFDEAVRYLAAKDVIGFDTESRPCFSPDQPHYGTSLLQLSGAKKAFLFRVKMTGIPPKLCSILSSKKILKVGAATADDVRGLQKYAKFAPEGFVDLQKMVWEYGIRDKSVKKMSAIILGVRISKTQQLSNWEAETLSEPQKKYAATDAWICREMYKKLMDSEKNPLSPEDMLPNPPKNPAAVQGQCVPAGGQFSLATAAGQVPGSDSKADKAGKKKRRNRHRNRNQRHKAPSQDKK